MVASVGTSTDVFTLDGHGLDDDDEVTLRPEAGGTMPAPLVAGTTYYAIRLSDATFSLAATAGGAAINLTTAGENVALITVAPWAKWIEEASNEIECTLPSAAVPLTAPYPAIVTAYAAGLVAEKALAFCGVVSTGLAERLKNVRAELAVWRSKGLVIRGATIPSAANLSVRSTVSAADPRGWVQNGNGVLP